MCLSVKLPLPIKCLDLPNIQYRDFRQTQNLSEILHHLKRQDRWVIAYQSAVGPLKWLKPSTESVIKALAHRGILQILVVPISFVSDHIETICEIEIEYKKYALSLGIKDFRMSKAIENHPRFISALADTVEGVINSPSPLTTKT